MIYNNPFTILDALPSLPAKIASLFYIKRLRIVSVLTSRLETVQTDFYDSRVVFSCHFRAKSRNRLKFAYAITVMDRIQFEHLDTMPLVPTILPIQVALPQCVVYILDFGFAAVTFRHVG